MREKQNARINAAPKPGNYSLQRTWVLMSLLFVLISVRLQAQQASGTFVSTYNFSSTAGTYSPITGGTATQISTTATTPTGGQQLGYLMPFNFRYNGKLYTAADALWINFNGYITIKSGVASPTVLTAGPLSSTNVAFNYTDGGMISAATSAQVGNGTALTGNTGTSTTFIRVGSTGTTPNRKFYIQFENFRRAAATADSWNYHIVINEDGGTQSNQIEFNYGAMTFGSATNVAKQVGLRGFVVNGDVQARTCAAGFGGWSASIIGAANTANSVSGSGSMLFNSTTAGTTYPVSGLSYRFTPCTPSTPYATVPYTMTFESSWTDYGCGGGTTKYSPGVNWKGGSLFGDGSWRRQDEGATSGFRFLPTGLVTPSPSTGAADFHTYGSNAGAQGSLDLYIDLSGGPKTLTFNTTNASGADVLDVFLSVDGGLTFGSVLASYGVNATWSAKSLTLSGGTATSVIRFRATSDFGNDDIGLDDVNVTVASTPPNCAVLVSPANGSSGQCPVIKWADGGGATSYDVYFGTATNPPLVVAGTTSTFYVPVGGYVNGQTYYWKIIPQNVNGPATGCVEYSYTAGTLASCYCTPTSTNGGTGGDAMTAISLATLNQTANVPIGPPGYKDDTGITVSVNQGSTYAATFTQQDASDAVKVWIDFNDNGTFEDAGEMVLQTGAGVTVLGNVAIPLTAPIGNHRLRIRNAYTPSNAIASVTSCSTVAFGETRDYTVNIAAAVNDASVTNVYSMGSLPKGYGDPHAVRARVYNGGAFTMTSLNVTMNITGANTYTNTQTVASLAPGASTIVTFAGFNPTSTGINTISVSVPSDDVNGNNSSSWDQDVTANVYSYKNPLQANFGGVGFNSATGDFVGKFAASSNFGNSDTINEVQVEFTTTGQNYQIGIWAADGVGGVPGTLIYTSPTYTTATGGPQIKAIPNVVVSGDFYVGARQIGTTNIGFAYQSEIPVRNQTFYFTSPSGAGTWQDFSQPANPAANPFRFSIQVRFEVPQIPLCPVTPLPANGGTGCSAGTLLSWNTGGGGTTSYDVYLSTTQSDVDNQLAGALVSNNQAGITYTTAALTAGQTYYWRVVGVNAYGESSGCTTQSFTASLYACYCASAGTTVDEYIGKVKIGSFSNTTASTSYGSYTGLGAATTAASGSSFNMEVTINGSYSSDVIHVFIDLNQDGDFNDANELATTFTSTVGDGTTNETYTISVPVNASALNGSTAMRIKAGDASLGMDNDPCQATFSFGEVEDYRIDIACGVVTASSNLACTGQDLNLASVFTSSETALSYAWSGPNSFSSAVQNPTITGITSAATGTYTITVNATNSCVATATLSIVVNDSPVLATSGGGQICAGTQLDVGVDNNAPGQTSGNTYSWTTNASLAFTSSQEDPTVTSSALPGHSGNYSVIVTNVYGCTGSASVAATVHSNPILSIVSQQDVGCQGGNDGVLTVSASNGTPIYIYSNDLFVTQNTTGVFTNLSAGSTTVEVQDNNSCSASISATLGFVNAAPPTASVTVPFAGMPGTICSGNTATLSIPAVANATKYVWDASSTAYFNGNPLNVSPFTSSTPNVTVTYTNPTGSFYVTGVQAANGCGSGSSIRKIMKVRGYTSVPASISGALTACANSSGTYTTGSVEAATQYLWTITGDATVSGTGTSVTVTFGPSFTSGTLCVSSQTSCYTSPSKCITISNTASTLGAISGVFTACPNSTASFSVPLSSGASSYNWTAPSGSSITSGAGTNAITVSYGASVPLSQICVSVTSVCGVTTGLKCKTVAPGFPTQPSSIVGPLSGVCGQTIVYSCPPVAGATSYTWTVPAGANITTGQGTQSISVLFGTFTTGSVCVTANNGCGSSVIRCVTVKGAPNSPGAITATPNCWLDNTAGVEFDVNTSALSGSYILSWAYPAPAIAGYQSGGGNTTQLVLNWVSGSGAVNVTASNACGAATKASTWSSSPSCRLASGAANATQLLVSPNPTTGIINISYSAVKGNAQVTVLDLAGRVVLTQNTTNVQGMNYQQLNLTKLAKGAYVLQVQGLKGKEQVRVVVE